MINNKGINFIFEAILVLFLVIILIFGAIKYYSHTTNATYLASYIKINDTLVIFSAENKADVQTLQKIMNFVFPDEHVTLFVDNQRIYGQVVQGGLCISKSAQIFVEDQFRKFEITLCQSVHTDL